MRHPSGKIWLTGDNRTGAGDGDDEQIIVLLDQLDERGLIHRQVDPDDRRARRIRITEKGRSLISRALDQQLARQRALNAVLSAEERETLSMLLRKLLIAVEDEPS